MDLKAIEDSARAATRLSERERQVLSALHDFWHDGEAWALNFKGIANRTPVPLRYVRGATRSLAAKGYAEHRVGLFNEDGGTAGSGYSCTESGAAVARALQTGEAGS